MDIDIPTLIDIVSRLKQENGWTRIQWKKVAAAYVAAVLGQWTSEEQTELALKKSFQKTLSTLYRNRDIKGWRRKKSETVEEVVHSTDNSTVRVPEDCKTLEEAVRTVKQDPRITTILLGRGEHQIDGNYLEVSSAMNIVGDPGVPKSEIVVLGGIQFKHGIQRNCHLQQLTLRQAKHSGVVGRSSFTMKDVLVDQCGWHGVIALGTAGVGRCTNVEVRFCGASGVYASNGASITLIGAKTTVHNNCTKGEPGSYGLAVYTTSDTIQLVSPLTKETVSTANGGGGNWGAGDGGRGIEGAGSSQQIKTIFERMPEAEVRVPEDCKTLQEAVERVRKDERLTTIVVGKGEYNFAHLEYLRITSALNIVGDSGVAKEEIVLRGGIRIGNGVQGYCHLQHLTLSQAEYTGVLARSSFTMEDVLVEQCQYSGVVVIGLGVVGRCTNVEVRQCGRSGVTASEGASVTLIGAKTTVHHNCTDGDVINQYGLKVDYSRSTIQLLVPLTKETVSIDNDGGANWGAGSDAAIQKIRTVLPPSIQPLYTQLFAACADRELGMATTNMLGKKLRELDGQGQLYVNYKNEQGLTMLATACLNGQIEIIKVLLKMPQIDGTMTREQFIQCTAFPEHMLEEELNHRDAITLEDTIVDCPVRCLPCRHPFEASNLWQWLGSMVHYEYNPQRREPRTKCPLCNTKVEKVELMSEGLVKRWNRMDTEFNKAEKDIEEAKKIKRKVEKDIAEATKRLNQNAFKNRFRQFVKVEF